jgi:hypothetical protein
LDAVARALMFLLSLLRLLRLLLRLSPWRPLLPF